MTMEEMQRQLARQQSRADIMNLMGRYQYYHTGGEMSRIGRELFAYWLPDARCEYGPLGVFGPEKSLQFFDAMTELFTGNPGACHSGLLEIHQITTPVLEVAEDNQTAKGMWMSTGAILMLHDEGAEEGRSFTWDSGKYAVDFINTDKGWRIWHLHVCDMWRGGPGGQRRPPGPGHHPGDDRRLERAGRRRRDGDAPRYARHPRRAHHLPLCLRQRLCGPPGAQAAGALPHLQRDVLLLSKGRRPLLPKDEVLGSQGLRPCHKDVSQLRKERIYVHH